MNLAIEYLIRSGAVRDLFETPCSLYVVGRYDADKIVITIDKGYTVKHWLLDQCKEENALPPMIEYRVTDVFESEAVVKPDYCLLEYQDDPIPSRRNTYREPMSADEYCSYSDKFPFSARHDQEKQMWLWRSFRRIYLSDYDIDRDFFHRIRSSAEIVADQQEWTIEHLPKFWKYWLMWIKYMMPSSRCPGELVFSGSYSLPKLPR